MLISILYAGHLFHVYYLRTGRAAAHNIFVWLHTNDNETRKTCVSGLYSFRQGGFQNCPVRSDEYRKQHPLCE